jgi:glycosyltransferase involved in cell wall biosynthesis
MRHEQKPLRILEIGEFSLFKRALPDQTTLVFTGANPRSLQDLDFRPFGPTMLPGLLRSLKRSEWDIVICFAPERPLLDCRRGLGGLLAAISRALFRFRTLGTYTVRVPHPVPLVVLDYNDMTTVPRPALKLLDRSIAYFKRELPLDPAKALFDVAPRFRTHKRIMASKFLQRNGDKFRPISVAIPEETVRLALATRTEKSVDVFFAGSMHSVVRQRGFEQLKALAQSGCSIDICPGGLSRAEYLERCARAWLTWSPEGFGWECFRHYEASLCLSVPVLSPPTIARYQPLLDGVHAFTYPVEADGLAAVIRRALENKPQLAAMARNAREHVLQHHTHERVCRHILETALK